MPEAQPRCRAPGFYRQRICSTILGPENAWTTMNAAQATAPPHRSLAAAARGRLLLWCAALVLLCQLFGAVGHDHDTEARAQDCVACSVHAQSLAAPPGPQPGAPTFAPFLVRVLPPPAVVARPATRASYLLPQPHAPPALVLPA
jgi:hypothetical protein